MLLDDPRLKTARHELRRGAWMLRAGTRQLAQQLASELRDQRDVTLRGLDEVREDLGTWWADDAPLERKLGSLRHMGREVVGALEEQARRLGERGTDLARANVTFARLQGVTHEHYAKQAYAPFFLSFHEAKAGVVLAVMSPRKRAELVPYAEKIREAQLRMGERTKGYSDCGLCPRPLGGQTGGGCCSSSVGQMFRPIDGLFRRLLDERAPVWPRFDDDFTRCGYMGPRGCVLPAGTRPVICVGFYCNAFREHLDKDGVWRALAPEFAQIRAAIRALEFRFSMHRRFLIGQGQTINDSTVGYLWSKLMTIYAAYDQVVPSTQTEGIDALSEAAPAAPPVAETAADAASTPRTPAEEGELSYEAGLAQVAAFLKGQGPSSPDQGKA